LRFKSGSRQSPNVCQLSSRLTQTKKTEERIWLNEVSSVALQHSVRQLGQAFQNFFNSCKGKRKDQRFKPPRFKKKSNQQTATFTKVGFSLKPNGGIRLAKPIGVVNPRCRLFQSRARGFRVQNTWFLCWHLFRFNFDNKAQKIAIGTIFDDRN